jgi:precorrin-4/cobalt-precorrin-4 C11-methyltransferase
MPPTETLEHFAASCATLVVHLSIHALASVVARLLPHYGAECAVAVVYRASWPDEKLIRGTLQDIVERVGEAPIERTATILVGPVLGDPTFRDSALYDIDYQRRFRGRAPA